MSHHALPRVALSELPQEAIITLGLIRLKEPGPFPFRKDGTIFNNAEGRLPSRPRGYYREYTVVTPGHSNRGLRRLVIGREGEIYYTEDHYENFVEVIRP